MQGREHANKIIGAFTSRHTIAEETEKRGRKKEGQKEEERKLKDHIAKFESEKKRKYEGNNTKGLKHRNDEAENI